MSTLVLLKPKPVDEYSDARLNKVLDEALRMCGLPVMGTLKKGASQWDERDSQQRISEQHEGNMLQGKAEYNQGELEIICLETADQVEEKIKQGSLQKCRILVAAALGSAGINLELTKMLLLIRRTPRCLRHSTGSIIVDAAGEMYTKAAGREIAAAMNMAGCSLPGRPLAEGTLSLKNYKVRAAKQKVSLERAYILAAADVIRNLLEYRDRWEDRGLLEPRDVPEHRDLLEAGDRLEYMDRRGENPMLLCVHCSNRATSNTLSLWEKVREKLPESIGIREISLRSSTIHDCRDCGYDACMYYSSQSGCYYGGSIVEEVYPALEKCKAMILLCPNYNDALSANLTAMINRLTALYRRTDFSDKYLFAIVVSGYSGSDLVVEQLIGSLCMNKAFRLPPEFALCETGNEPGSALEAEGIEEKIEQFARRIEKTLV